MTDTEVLLHGWEEYGDGFVARLRGMFAFALWDRRARRLLLCRDRVGVKPLFWYWRDGLFMFSSELKAFHRHPGFTKRLDPRALSSYLSFGYVTAPHAIFEDEHRLRPGHMLVLEDSGSVREFSYWSPREAFLRGAELERSGYWAGRSEVETVDELEALLTESARYRMIADVPVGVFLSGGIDSSTVAAFCAVPP